jgi:dTDP-3,4-didehydro-2,6-dideoxy-alpha-D-glucose 3-reductase
MPGDALPRSATPLRVAVWGLGGHAERRLLPALAQCAATTLAGTTTRDTDRGRRLAELFGCAFWPTAEDMLRSDSVDVVLVATPIGCHLAHGRAVLQAGKHLWCEKSLTSSAEGAEALIAEARRRELVLAECFMFVYHPQFRVVRAEAASLGPIASLTSRFFMPVLERPGFRHSRSLGGGALLDVGCYPVHAALQLLGDDLEVSDARLVQPPGSEVDMMGHAVLVSPSGATALLEWGFGAAYRNDLTLCCVGGSFDVDRVFSKTPEHDPALLIRDIRGAARTVPVAKADSFTEMFGMLAGAATDDALRDQLFTSAGAQARLVERVRSTAARA